MNNLLYSFINYNTYFKITLLNNNAKQPYKADIGCAGYDIFSTEELIVPTQERRLVSIGISCEIPPDFYLRVAPLSGLSVKGIDIGAGVIDSSYRGELKVLVINNSFNDFKIDIGTKIAQLILERCANPTIEIVEKLNFSERGENGFGSTGEK